MDAGLPQGRQVIETLLMRMWSNMQRQRQQQQAGEVAVAA